MDFVPVNPKGPAPILSAPAANVRKEVSAHGLGYRVNAIGGIAIAGAGAAPAAGGGVVAGVPVKANNVRREVGAAGLNYRVGAAAAGAGVKKKG
jgi:hypothetical protein